MDKNKQEITIEAEKSSDTKRNKTGITYESSIKRLETQLETYYTELNEKFEVLKKHGKAYELKFNYWSECVQELLINKKSKATEAKSKLYNSSLMNFPDLLVCLEVMMVIGSLYGFAQITYILISKLLSLIF
jgi:hypothetical protein